MKRFSWDCSQVLGLGLVYEASSHLGVTPPSITLVLGILRLEWRFK